MNNGNWLLPVDRVIVRIAKWLVYISALSAVVIIAIAVIDVVSSKTVNWSIPSSVEFIGELNVLLVFLVIAYAAQERGHIRITIMEKYMSPAVKFAFKLFMHFIAILVGGLCTWRTVVLVQTSIESHVIRSGGINFPVWPFNIAVLIGFTFRTIVYILLFARAIIGRSNPEAETL